MKSNKKKDRLSISSKITQVAKLLRTQMHKALPLKKEKVSSKTNMPNLSPANAIERISKMIREEIHRSQERKVSGE